MNIKPEETENNDSKENQSICKEVKPPENWSDKHYNFDYQLTEADIKAGKVKIDPYFVANAWKLGKKDNTGILFHNLKTIARFGAKNSIEREVKGLYNQTKRLAALLNIDLEGGK